MPIWLHKIKLKHLFTESEDREDLQRSMSAIAEACQKSGLFIGLHFKKWHNLPKGDDVFSPVDYANKLMTRLYDYADDHRIWIE